MPKELPPPPDGSAETASLKRISIKPLPIAEPTVPPPGSVEPTQVSRKPASLLSASPPAVPDLVAPFWAPGPAKPRLRKTKTFSALAFAAIALVTAVVTLWQDPFNTPSADGVGQFL